MPPALAATALAPPPPTICAWLRPKAAPFSSALASASVAAACGDPTPALIGKQAAELAGVHRPDRIQPVRFLARAALRAQRARIPKEDLERVRRRCCGRSRAGGSNGTSTTAAVAVVASAGAAVAAATLAATAIAAATSGPATIAAATITAAGAATAAITAPAVAHCRRRGHGWGNPTKQASSGQSCVRDQRLLLRGATLALPLSTVRRAASARGSAHRRRRRCWGHGGGGPTKHASAHNGPFAGGGGPRVVLGVLRTRGAGGGGGSRITVWLCAVNAYAVCVYAVCVCNCL